MSVVDLWPDTLTEQPIPDGPTSILKQQAALLGEKTKNLVEAEVIGGIGAPGKFADRFILFGPAINYRYELFTMETPVDLYPVALLWQENKYTAESPEALQELLKMIFSDEKTRKIISAIIARSGS